MVRTSGSQPEDRRFESGTGYAGRSGRNGRVAALSPRVVCGFESRLRCTVLARPHRGKEICHGAAIFFHAVVRMRELAAEASAGVRSTACTRQHLKKYPSRSATVGEVGRVVTPLLCAEQVRILPPALPGAPRRVMAVWLSG